MGKKLESLYEEQLKAHREKIGKIGPADLYFKKSQEDSGRYRGQELVLRVKTVLASEGKQVSLRRVAAWLGAWSTVQ